MVLVLFDIDGTLLTSNGLGRGALFEALSDACNTRLCTDNVSFSGRTDPAIVRDILKNTGLSPAQIEKMMPVCLQRYVDVMAQALTPQSVNLLPGVYDLLTTLADREEFKLGVITGNLKQTAYLKLEAANIASFFPFGAFGSDNEDRNELPAMAHRRAEAHHQRRFKKSFTAIIGDTEHDIRCSRHFGAHAIAVSTGRASTQELANHNPDLLLKSLSSPARLIEYLCAVLDG